MRITSTMRPGIWRRTLATGALIVAGLAAGVVPLAQATHHDHGTTRLHNGKIHTAATGHSAAADEDFCTQIGRGDGALSEATLRTVVDDALLTQPSHWDGAGGWKLDMYHTASNCFDPIYGDRSSLEIQYRTYKTQTDGKWCSDNISCVSHYNVIWSSTGHQDYQNEVVWLDQDHVTAGQYLARQILSHETGHVVGFRDPDFQGHCGVASILHIPYYGCADPGSGPTANDLSVLANDIMLGLTH